MKTSIFAALTLLCGSVYADLSLQVSEQDAGVLGVGSFSDFEVIELSSDYVLEEDGFTQLGLTLTDTSDNTSTTLTFPFIVDALARADEINTSDISVLVDGTDATLSETTAFEQFNLIRQTTVVSTGNLSSGIKSVTITNEDTAGSQVTLTLPFVSEFIDSDGDGVANVIDDDDDNDGVPDVDDAFPFSAIGSSDTDQDGIADSVDPDDDNDGIPDEEDSDPLNVDDLELGEPMFVGSELFIGSADVAFLKDGDVVNSAMLSVGADGMSGVRQVEQVVDAVEFDVDESYDAIRLTISDLRISTASIEVGFDAAHIARLEPLPDDIVIASAEPLDLVDPRVSYSALDGFLNIYDVGLFPEDPEFETPYFLVAASLVTGDGFSEVTTFSDRSIDDDNLPAFLDDDFDDDGYVNAEDAYPEDPLQFELVDTDNDGIPDDEDADDDGDGVPDIDDVFPLDGSEVADLDGDGVGDNADTDDDGDGVPDSEDAYPQDPDRSALAGRIKNISTRTLIRTGDEVLIGGVIVSGTEPKQLLVRVRGPSLEGRVPGFIGNPIVELRNASGRVALNDAWQTRDNFADIPSNLRPSSDDEAAVLLTVDPGAYTAIVRGVSATSGVGIVEIFELTDTGETRISNISTRGYVGTGDNVMIGGVIITGDEPVAVTFRARGPSLGAAGVPNTLVDPKIELFDSSGKIDENDNWRNHSSADEIRQNLAPTYEEEAAITTTLEPGAYTAIVRGVGGTEGIGLFEVYELR